MLGSGRGERGKWLSFVVALPHGRLQRVVLHTAPAAPGSRGSSAVRPATPPAATARRALLRAVAGLEVREAEVPLRARLVGGHDFDLAPGPFPLPCPLKAGPWHHQASGQQHLGPPRPSSRASEAGRSEQSAMTALREVSELYRHWHHQASATASSRRSCCRHMVAGLRGPLAAPPPGAGARSRPPATPRRTGTAPRTAATPCATWSESGKK